MSNWEGMERGWEIQEGSDKGVGEMAVDHKDSDNKQECHAKVDQVRDNALANQSNPSQVLMITIAYEEYLWTYFHISKYLQTYLHNSLTYTVTTTPANYRDFQTGT